MALFSNNILYLIGGFVSLGVHNKVVESFIQRKSKNCTLLFYVVLYLIYIICLF